MTEPKTKIEAGLFNDTSMYRDIMFRPQPNPKAHLRMNREDRAAQFAPFAALTGYQELIDKRAAIYAHKQYPDAAQVAKVTAQLQQCQGRQQLCVQLNYFNDTVGLYQTTTASLVRVDWDRGVVFLQDQDQIAIANIRWIKAAQA
ncbi:hypothetical protein RA086_08725 [Lactiplantibacillus sp. WILCCON 0030]|uniref:YolD-like family protein n=1 Tax=Lactiplantibacillus brownii TaxID=3069269 RepID=A0ABU1A9U4_9LACO|nr:hypothetical protein [Lactiplantibacillus brownii]MDQ7937691.1 hypothetical protein [Lactiplantibacillus brownii]